MTPVDLLPHLGVAFNACVILLLVGGRRAIRRGDRALHPRMMLGALAAGLLFLVSYLLQVALGGHGRFPGEDWVRTVFLAVLASHTLLAVLVVPLALWTVTLAARARFAAHRRLAPVTFWIWLYVSLTGVLIYWMSHHLRPPV